MALPPPLTPRGGSPEHVPPLPPNSARRAPSKPTTPPPLVMAAPPPAVPGGAKMGIKRGGGKGEGRSAKSASPRPQRVRPVDTVKQAKKELANGELLMTAGRLRLMNVAHDTEDTLGQASESISGLHEGFFDFAAAVVRPQLTARQHASQLRERLEAGIKQLRGQSGHSPQLELPHSNSAPLLALPPPSQDDPSPSSATFATAVDAEAEAAAAIVVAGGVAAPGSAELQAARAGAGHASGAARISKAAQLQLEVNYSFDVLTQYIQDTTTDSKERAGFLSEAQRTAGGALEALMKLTESCVRDLEASDSRQSTLQESMDVLIEENQGLRHVMRQMLATEAELRQDISNKEDRVEELAKEIEQASATKRDLDQQLLEANEMLERLLDEKRRHRDVRDATNSPMMGFSAFVMTSDAQVPPLGWSSEEPGTGFVPKAADSIGGGPSKVLLQEQSQVMQDRRRTMTSGLAIAQAREIQSSQSRLSAARASRGASVEVEFQLPHEAYRQRSGSASPADRPDGAGSPRSAADRSPRRGHENEGAGRGKLSPSSEDDEEEAADRPQSVTVRGGKRHSSRHNIHRGSQGPGRLQSDGGTQRQEESGASDRRMDADEPFMPDQDSALSAFPALIPFLDFSKIDPDLEKAQAEAKEQNQEHLNKHLAALQSEYEQESEANKALQRSVDTALERLLVWLHAMHDALQSCSLGSAVQQDADAISVCRSMVEWLAKHPCAAWSSDMESIDEVFDRHEATLRSHLARERPRDAEVQDLRSGLAKARKQVVELTEQLSELRASILPGRGARLELGGRGKARAKSPAPLQMVGMTPPFSSASPHTPTPREDAPSASIASTAVVDSGSHMPPPLLGRGSPEEIRKQPTRVFNDDFGVQCDLIKSPGAAEYEDHQESHLDEFFCRSCGKRRSSAQAPPLQGPAGTRRAAARSEDHPGLLSPGASAADEAAGQGRRRSDGLTGEGKNVEQQHALESTDFALRRMRLLASPFVESIDFTMVSTAGGQQGLLKQPLPAMPPATGGSGARHASFSEDAMAVGGFTSASPSSPSRALLNSGREDANDRLIKVKALQALLHDAYAVKKTDDQRRDKVGEERRPLHVVLQELLRRQHGVKKVVHQKSWQLVEGAAHLAEMDPGARLFCDFLDGSRDLDELSFYLYCSSVLSVATAEEIQALPPKQLPSGSVGVARAIRMVELLFGDLPKALGVARDELLKCIRYSSAANDFQEVTYGHGHVIAQQADPDVRVDDLYRVLLEGWRMSALLLDKSVPGFSWRRCVLAFMQGDLTHRGWLDPHEVRDSEVNKLRLDVPGGVLPDADGLRLLDRTSLGAFVFRAVHRCGKANSSIPGSLGAASADAGGGTGLELARTNGVPLSQRQQRQEAKRQMDEACLAVSKEHFESLEKSLGVYLTWLMHSEELRDVSVYHSVKARIYEFRRSLGESEAPEGARQLRSLLLLLLAHQYDLQLQQGELQSKYLDWELRCLVSILRESWKRGTTAEAMPLAEDVAEAAAQGRLEF
eukprot:TRINITY_DN6850_c0_g1_i2.p1 TRINITY_DN6850_c0_g1~~TRINITY_DN6850_c0_g1_i2.p1  ORF type:complete len:1517 (+),score=399.65 TRINITY_DN6850_c0_g1_i2:138-4688(+)